MTVIICLFVVFISIHKAAAPIRSNTASAIKNGPKPMILTNAPMNKLKISWPDHAHAPAIPTAVATSFFLNRSAPKVAATVESN